MTVYYQSVFVLFQSLSFRRSSVCSRELLVFSTLLLGGLTSEKLAGSSQMREQHQMLSGWVNAHGKKIDMKCKAVYPLKCSYINVHIFALACLKQRLPNKYSFVL